MSDGMGREFTYLSSHATNRYFIPNWGKEYNIHQAFVLSNAKNVEVKNGVTYLPIYYIACIMPEGSV